MKIHPQIKLAREAFYELSHVFYHEMRNHAETLLDMCKAEEKQHRGFLPSFRECHTEDTASVTDAAKLFAVRRVAEYLSGTKYPEGQEYLHTHKSCFQAAAIADEFGEQIRKAWVDFDLAELSALNYTDVVKVRREVAA